MTNLTNKNLADIWNYTFDYLSEEQADYYYGQQIHSFSEISENPTMGINYNESVNGLFGLKVNKNIIFYRALTKEKVEITRILHERMDRKSRLKSKFR